MIREYNNDDFIFISNSLSNFGEEIDLKNIISNPFTKIYIYEDNYEKKGFIIASKYYERMEIDYIYVCEKYRKMGIGNKLIAFLIENNHDIVNITLEVDTTNKAAINLYEKNNFQIVATRERYYKNGNSAYLMERK